MKKADLFWSYIGLRDYFLPAYYKHYYGGDERFYSLTGRLILFFLRHPVAVLLMCLSVPVLAALFIEQPLHFFLLFGPAISVLSFFFFVLALLLLTALEAMAKLMACMLFYGELPRGPENIVDLYILRRIRGD